MKRLIGIVGIVLLVLVVVSVANPSLFDFLQVRQESPLPDTTTVYAYGANGLVSKQKGSEVSYYHSDNLGSSSLVTDDDGVVKYSTDYYPFGSSLHGEGEEKYTYNSKELDNTGLHYYGARYYDATVGRFISVDPVAGNLYNPQRLNRYSYTLNNPLKYVDVNGESVGRSLTDDERIVVVYVSNEWEAMIKDHVSDIVSISEQMGVPPEATLAAIFVEDIRMYSPDLKSLFSKSSIKATIRGMVPNNILTATGHNPNPGAGMTAFGVVWRSAIKSATNYFECTNSCSNLELANGYYNPQSEIFEVTLVLKSHMEYWASEGYDIFEYNFDTVDSLAERVGILETVNSMSRFRGAGDNELGKFISSPGFYTYEGRRITPHGSPRQGGTELWRGRTNYGKISSALVSSGEAQRLIDEYGQ